MPFDKRSSIFFTNFRILKAMSSKLNASTQIRSPSSSFRIATSRLRPALKDSVSHKGIPKDFQSFTRQQLYEVIDKARVAIGLRGLHGEWLAFNGRMCAMFGYTPDEFRAITTVELTPESERAQAIEFNRLMASGKLWSYQREKSYLHKSGKVLYCLLSVSVLASSEGKPSHLISIIEDLTEMQEARRILKASKDRLEAEVRARTSELSRALDLANAANEAKRNILANTSHEMKTPLNAIIGFSEVLSDGVGLAPDKIIEYATAINSGGRRLLKTVDDILEIARWSDRSTALEPQIFEIVTLVQDRIRNIKTGAAETSVTFSALSAPDHPCLVNADLRSITRALDAILDNAVKFSLKGGEVSVSILAGDRCATKVIVLDRGVGIPDDKIARVFEPFFQIDAGLSRRYEGCGLGLTIAKSVIEANGGEISIFSKTGLGTQVSFTLPEATEVTHESQSLVNGPPA